MRAMCILETWIVGFTGAWLEPIEVKLAPFCKNRGSEHPRSEWKIALSSWNDLARSYRRSGSRYTWWCVICLFAVLGGLSSSRFRFTRVPPRREE